MEFYRRYPCKWRPSITFEEAVYGNKTFEVFCYVNGHSEKYRDHKCLVIAIIRRYTQLVKYFLREGVGIEYVNKRGNNIYHTLFSNSHMYFKTTNMNQLLSQQNCDKRTPYHFYAMFRQSPIFKYPPPIKLTDTVVEDVFGNRVIDYIAIHNNIAFFNYLADNLLIHIDHIFIWNIIFYKNIILLALVFDHSSETVLEYFRLYPTKIDCSSFFYSQIVQKYEEPIYNLIIFLKSNGLYKSDMCEIRSSLKFRAYKIASYFIKNTIERKSDFLNRTPYFYLQEFNHDIIYDLVRMGFDLNQPDTNGFFWLLHSHFSSDIIEDFGYALDIFHKYKGVPLFHLFFTKNQYRTYCKILTRYRIDFVDKYVDFIPFKHFNEIIPLKTREAIMLSLKTYHTGLSIAYFFNKKTTDDECIVCHEEKTVYYGNCASPHLICLNCSICWYRNKNTCPYCRKNVFVL